MPTPLVRGAGGSRTGSRGEDTRRLALRSAEDVFATLGYAGARMEDVAERVGIRRASLMYYFRDKQALYEALLDDLFGGLLEGYEAALAGPEPLTERYLRCIDLWAARVEERPALLRISMWEMAGATPEEEVPLTAHVDRSSRASPTRSARDSGRASFAPTSSRSGS